MKKQFLSVLAFTAILLSSCGGTAKIEKASACGQEGVDYGFFGNRHCRDRIRKVAGYVEKWYLYI